MIHQKEKAKAVPLLGQYQLTMVMKCLNIVDIMARNTAEKSLTLDLPTSANSSALGNDDQDDD